MTIAIASLDVLAALRSTNPLQRFNREISRTDNDEWLVGRSYISQGSIATLQTSSAMHPSFSSEQEVAEQRASGAPMRQKISESSRSR